MSSFHFTDVEMKTRKDTSEGAIHTMQRPKCEVKAYDFFKTDK